MAVESAQKRWLTAEDMARPGMPEKWVELIDGELVQMSPAGKRHNRIANNFIRVFQDFIENRPELDYSGDNDGFLLRRNPDTLLSPDAALYRARPEAGTTWEEYAPEIVVEILSPSNNIGEMAYKRSRYFEAGVEQFWLVKPNEQVLEVHFRDNRVVRATAEDTLEGEGVAAGLSLKLSTIFRKR